MCIRDRDKTVNPLSSLITTLLGELAAIERQGIIAVSYTHLDVYKRQVMRNYAEGFGKGLKSDDVEYYAKIHFNRDGV